MQPFKVPQLGVESFGQVPGSGCPPEFGAEFTGTEEELEGTCVLVGMSPRLVAQVWSLLRESRESREERFCAGEERLEELASRAADLPPLPLV